jgi:hypothetical protein
MDGPSIFAADQANSGGVLVVLSHKSLFFSELLPKLKLCVVMQGEKWSYIMAGIAACFGSMGAQWQLFLALYLPGRRRAPGSRVTTGTPAEGP